jgi:WD40 repeat protein
MKMPAAGPWRVILLLALGAIFTEAVVVWLWPPWSYAPRASLCLPFRGGQFLRGFSADGKTLFAFYQVGEVGPRSPRDSFGMVLWDVETKRPLRTLPGVYGWQAFSRDGRLMAAAEKEPDGSHLAKVWEVSTGNVRDELGPLDRVFAGEFTPDGQRLVQVLLTAGTLEDWSYTSHRYDTFSRSSHLHLHGLVRVCDVTAGTVRRTFTLPSPFSQFELSADAATLATVDEDGILTFWGVSEGTRLGTLPRPLDEWERCIRFSPDGRVLATGLTLWDLPKKREMASASREDAFAHQLAFSADSTRCLWLKMGWDDRRNGLRVLDVPTATELRSFPGYLSSGGPLAAGWDRDGGIISGGIHTQPTASGQAFAALSPDNRILATQAKIRPPIGDLKPVAPTDVKLWDVDTGRELAAVEDRSQPFISPDGKLLATVSGSRIELWDIPPQQPIVSFLIASVLQAIGWLGLFWLWGGLRPRFTAPGCGKGASPSG